ncbi:MAG: nuclease-related domain-containing protein [Tissierellaceae bacterium]|nr:nuclease-related domain-containing protein [Tissierellaceae bacterium]
MSLILLFIMSAIMLMPKYLKFRNSEYMLESGNSFIKTVFDKGKYGEFLTFTYLEELDFFKKLLVNIYVPKDDGSTTEIDLVMLSPTGIYVFESKNYSGWIFGNEKSKYWTQTLQNKQKNKFFNPIWQNKGHITALKNNLELVEDSLFKSYIIFSERCELKKVERDSTKVKVIKRNHLISTLKEDIANSDNVFKVDEILDIYIKLKQYSNVDAETKIKHIESIT